MEGRKANDGAWVETGSDDRVESVNGSEVERGMSGTTCWDSDGNARVDEGSSGDNNGDRK